MSLYKSRRRTWQRWRGLELLERRLMLDGAAPGFVSGYPALTHVTASSFELQLEMNESGRAYYVVVADGADAPTPDQVKAGTDSAGGAAVTSGFVDMTKAYGHYSVVGSGLSVNTAYDLYVVAQDTGSSPSLQTSPTRLDLHSIRVTEGTFGDSGQTIGSGASLAMAMGDLDGDGDPDAFVANALASANRVWLNGGDGVFVASGQFLGNGNSAGVALGDVDGDGDLDAYVANTGDADKIWLNDGDGLFSDSGQSLGGSNSKSVALGDFDLDGDLDAFVTCYGEANRVWLNDGSGTYTDSGQTLGYYKSFGVSLGDLDNDGDLDAFVCNGDEQANIVWLNNGAGVFAENGQPMGESTSRAVALYDFTGDGLLDALVANADNQPNRLWRNIGAGIFTDTGQALGANDSYGVALGDIEGDGDIDAFFANSQGDPNIAYLNNGSGTLTAGSQQLGSGSSTAVWMADLDGDYDMDAFCAQYDEPNVLWLNKDVTPPQFVNGYPQVHRPTSLSLDLLAQLNEPGKVYFVVVPRGADSPNAGEVKAGVGSGSRGQVSAGSFDVAVAERTYRGTAVALDVHVMYDIYLLAEDAEGNVQTGPTLVGGTTMQDSEGSLVDGGQSLGTANSKSVATGDVDGDGDIDAFVANYGAGNTVWLNDGNGTFINSGQSLGNAASRAVALFDYDKDGDLDAFVANGNGAPNTVWKNNGSGVFTATGLSLGSGDSYDVFVTDFNGDGYSDAVISNYGTDNVVWVYAGGDQKNFNRVDLGMGNANTTGMWMADLDGDNDKDIYAVIDGAADQVWLNNGSNSFVNSGQSLSSGNGKAIGMADLDNDLDLDAVVANSGSASTIWLNDGSGLFADAGQSLGSGSAMDVAVRDFNGDGAPDVMLVYTTGQADAIWLNDGDGLMVANGQSLGGSNGNAVSVMDLNDDGALDAFVANNGANTVWFNADTTPPSFVNLTPNIASLEGTQFTLNVQLNERGTTYYVLLADGAAAPSSAQVKAGTDGNGNGALKSGNLDIAASNTNYQKVIWGLTAETAYDLYVVAQDKESVVNVQSAPTLVELTTPDEQAPSVSSYSPVNNATDVAVGVVLTLTFDESVAKGDGDLTIYNAADQLVRTISVDSSDVSVSGAMVQITLSQVLDGETGYYVLADRGVINDISGNAWAGISQSGTWGFTTADVTEPSVASRSPGNNAVRVPIDTNLILNFTEDVQADTGNLTIYTAAGAVFETMDVTGDRITFDGVSMTIDPTTDLTGESSYYILLDATAVADASGNHYPGITNSGAWRFTTADVTPPELTATTPVDGADDIAVGTPLTMTFTEQVVRGDGTISLYDGNGQVIASWQTVDSNRMSVSGATVTLNVVGDLPSETDFYVLADSGAIVDVQDNPWSGISDPTAWRFRTADITDPTLTQMTPADAAVGVAVTSALVLQFSEPVVAVNGNVTIRRAADDSEFAVIPVDGDQLSGSGTAQITIQSPLTLESLTDYYVQIDASCFDDLKANSYAGISSTTAWRFQSADVVPPEVTAYSPSMGQTGVSALAPLRLTFDEKVTAVAGRRLSILRQTDDSVFAVVDMGSVLVAGSGSNQIVVTAGKSYESETAYYVLIEPGALLDTSANPYPGILVPGQWSFVSADVQRPRVTLSGSVANPTNAAFQVTASFTEDVQGFDAQKLAVVNASISQMRQLNTTDYQFTVTPLVDGPVSVRLPSLAVSDPAGNRNYASNLISTVYDGTPPTVAVHSLATGNPIHDQSFDVQVIFSEPVIGFALDDLQLSNLRVTNLQTLDQRLFTLTCTPAAVGKVKLQVPADVVQDAVGYANSASDELRLMYLGPQEQLPEVGSGRSIDYPVPDSVFNQLQTGNITWYATQLDGSPLPRWMQFDPTDQSLTGKPTQTDVGTWPVKVIGIDGAGKQVSQRVDVQVSSGVPVVDLHRPLIYELTSDFATLDQSKATYTVGLADGRPIPDWLDFDATSQTFTGTPPNRAVGSYQIKVAGIDQDGDTVEKLFTMTVTRPQGDFGGDGEPDALWQDSDSGEVKLTLLDQWQMVGNADWNSDGKLDILWFDRTTGKLSAWLMDGINFSQSRHVGQMPGRGWMPFGTSNRNGDALVFWQNTITGDLSQWVVDPVSLQVTDHPFLGTTEPNSPWLAKSAGDMNNDGVDDILLANQQTGDLVAWLYDTNHQPFDRPYVGAIAPGDQVQVMGLLSGRYGGVMVRRAGEQSAQLWQLIDPDQDQWQRGDLSLG